MSNLTLILVVTGLLTLLGSAALFLVTVKYYWGERGTAPPTGEERRRLKREELERRQKQLEYSEKHPREPRSPDFFDNRKRAPGPPRT
jgi:hypothetical protein